MHEEKLSQVTVKSISDLIVKEPALVTPDSAIDAMLSSVIEDTRSRHAYVIDADGHLIGSVRFNNIIQYLFPSTLLLEIDGSPRVSSFLEYSNAKLVKDIMNTRPKYVYETTPLSKMVRIMMEEKINELPVVDRAMKVIGEVNLLEIIAYNLKNH